jgi:hypothetical protein
MDWILLLQLLEEIFHIADHPSMETIVGGQNVKRISVVQ